jgi:hypothetical protein|tara:strand:- start:8571 stop:8720 length:150 start_codon:yes stop_codon:yes gene_type:complete
MGNTITVNVGNRGSVAPASGGGNSIAIGQQEEEEEVGCLEKLGCLLCGG